jgi:hypothetical protein
MLAPIIAQEHEALDAAKQWIARGDDIGTLRSSNGKAVPRAALLEDVIEADDTEHLVAAVVAAAENASLDTDVRTRAVSMLLACAADKRIRSCSDRARTQLCRTISRLVATPALALGLRQELLEASAGLEGQPERLDWLLEGEVRLRNSLLAARGRGAVVDPELLPAVLSYFDALGKDALPVLPLLRELSEAKELDAALRRHCIHAYARIASKAGPEEAAAAFARCLGDRAAQPLDADDLLRAAHTLAKAQPKLLRQPIAATAFLALTDQFEIDPPTDRRLSTLRFTVAAMIEGQARDLASVRDPELRKKVILRCDALAETFAASSLPALRTAASAWQRVREH